MFGYVTVNRPEMKVKELELYRSYYCGLCHALHERYGRKGQMLLSYDGTFLAILLSGLYEPGEKERRTRCIVHPTLVHREKSNRFIDYAADMNVLLAYRKALDDWQDEAKPTARAMAVLLRKDYCRIRSCYPRQEKALTKNIRALARMEKEGSYSGQPAGEKDGASYEERMSGILSRIDRAAGYTGHFLAEMCVTQKDRWERELRSVGFFLGKFIYLIDAYDDLEKDAQTLSFNVLLELRDLDREHFDDTVKEILLDTAAMCCRAFERLPILRDVELLRNILYSGIWVRFYEIRSKEPDRKNKKI